MQGITRSIKVAAALCRLLFSAFFPLTAEAALQLPSYASGGNLQGDLTSTGQSITNILIAVTVMVGIGGIIWAGMAFASGDGETGKRRLWHAVIGLILAATATGIAAIAVGAAR